MYKYFILFHCFSYFIISGQAISSEPFNLSKLECVKALSKQKRVRVSDIEITKSENEVTKLQEIIEIIERNGAQRDKILEFVKFPGLNENNKDDRDEINSYIDFALHNLLYTISLPLNGKVKSIGLTIETAEAYNTFDSTAVLREIKEILADLPETALNLVNEIIITYKRYEEETSSTSQTAGMFISADKNAIRILIDNDIKDFFNSFKDFLDKNFPGQELLIDFNTGLSNLIVLDHLRSTIYHEVGHMIAYHKYGTVEPDLKWHDAILADNTSISENGKTSIPEDFADTMWLYLETNGGIYYPTIVKKYANRFAILDEIMKLSPSHREQVDNLNYLTSALLKELGFIINDFFEELDIDSSEYFESPIKDQLYGPNLLLTLKRFQPSRSTDFIAYLIEFWKTRFNNKNLIKRLFNKINTIPKDRLLDSTSIENRLTREVLKYVKHVWRDKKIFEFVIENIYLLDTLPTSEMNRRLEILEKANRDLKQIKPSKYIAFEEALKVLLENEFEEEARRALLHKK